MFAISFCLLWLASMLFPQTAVARVFRKLLVEAPERALRKLTAGRMALVLIVIVASLVILSVMRADGAVVLAQGLPEGVGWLVTFDIASYVDVGIVVMGAAAAVGLRGATVLARHGARSLARPVSRLRARRSARRSRPGGGSGEDPGWRHVAPTLA